MRREWLVVERFAALLRALGRTGDAAALNRAYLDHLGEGSYLLPGAQALCRALAPRCTLAIVTNGVARAQRRRFEASPLNGLIPWLFISEELGASKPDPAFFAPVLRTLGNPDPRRVLMVASGANKAQAIKDAFFGPVTPQVPASILQYHPDFTLVADEAALSLL